MSNAFDRLRHALREYGPHAFLLLVLTKALQKLSAGWIRIVPYHVVAQPIGRTASSVRQDPSTTTARIERSDAIRSEFPRDSMVIEHRFDIGAECYVTRSKGIFAGYIWLARNRYVEDEVRCTYVLPQEPACVWDFDVYVAERFRLGRTMARMWAAVDEALGREGVAWTVSRISMFNPASLSSHRRLGALRLEALVFVTMGRWQVLLRSRWPCVHICGPGGDGPRVILSHASLTELRAPQPQSERT